jgi:hypothetical protein
VNRVKPSREGGGDTKSGGAAQKRARAQCRGRCCGDGPVVVFCLWWFPVGFRQESEKKNTFEINVKSVLLLL